MLLNNILHSSGVGCISTFVIIVFIAVFLLFIYIPVKYYII